MHLFSPIKSFLSELLEISQGVLHFTYPNLLNRLFTISSKSKKILTTSLDQFLIKTSFIGSYYRRNENLWQDGFLIDFLQKKVVDKWTRKFLIISAYLFNERVVFDRVIRAYLDLVVWSGNKIFIFEFNNIASTLFTTSLLLVLLFLTLALNYWFILLL